MFRTIRNLLGSPIEAEDGLCGKCSDFLFDDREYAIRYIVVDTGGILQRNQVVLSPLLFRDPDLGAYSKTMPVNVSKERIDKAPPLDEAAPVSREYEEALARYYNHDAYWVGSDVWGFGPHPVPVPNPSTTEELAEDLQTIRDHHLRSANELLRYQIRGSDGEIGSVQDFVVETKLWQIRFYVVDTGGWLPGRKVLLSPLWEDEIRWEDKSISFELTREQIENSPEFDPRRPVNQDYEGAVYDYYGKPRRN